MSTAAINGSAGNQQAAAAELSPAGNVPQLVHELLAENDEWTKTFSSSAQPTTLGVRRKLSVVCCMDSRLLLDKLLPGVDVGDIEMIRNAGGRVTPDVLRSLFVAQEVPELATRAVLILHHTDCGAQAAMRHHDLLVDRMRQLLGEYGTVTWLLQAVVSTVAGLLVPAWLRRKMVNAVTRPFADPVGSVREDVWLLRHAPFMPKDIPIHGMVYDCDTGRLHHVVSSLGQQK